MSDKDLFVAIADMRKENRKADRREAMEEVTDMFSAYLEAVGQHQHAKRIRNILEEKIKEG